MENDIKQIKINILIEYLDRVRAHYPYTNSIKSTLIKEFKQLEKEILENEK